MNYSAVIVGGTGLVGSFLVQELINDNQCAKIKLITRRKIDINHPKVEECIIDFNNSKDYLKYIKGDVLFSCLGTTLKQAGSKEKQYLVDYTYQYRAAESAKQNSIPNYVLVSSPWSSLTSNNYYRKMKAELEEAVTKLGFKKTVLIKPNGLVGKRSKPRIGEKYAMRFFTFLTTIIPALRKHKPIKAEKVAKAMHNAFYMCTTSSLISYCRDEVLKLSNQNLKVS